MVFLLPAGTPTTNQNKPMNTSTRITRIETPYTALHCGVAQVVSLVTTANGSQQVVALSNIVTKDGSKYIKH